MERRYLCLYIVLFLLLNALLAQISGGSTAINTKTSKDKPIQILSTGRGYKKVLIYCTHYWESYLSDINRPSALSTRAATDGKKNVTFVGKRLMKALEKEGIGSVFVSQAYTGKKSYKKSRNMITTVLKSNKNVTYLIDIHRDIMHRHISTCSINGKTYATIVFVVGSAGKYYQKNLELAQALQRRLNRYHPGLSKHIVIKHQTSRNNGEYNQSLSPHSLLIEVGGHQNSFEEAYRTISLFAKILSEKMKKEVPVSGYR